MWVCLVPGQAPAGAEMRIRAWTADRKRMESLRTEGLDMQPLYAGAQGSGDCGAWQPIETAPKDQTAIWLLVNNKPYIGYYDPPQPFFKRSGSWVVKASFLRRPRNDNVPDEIYGTHDRDVLPSHWMPLPAPSVPSTHDRPPQAWLDAKAERDAGWPDYTALPSPDKSGAA